MDETIYQFTGEQLKQFLSEYAGITLDATGEESLQALLEALADKGELKILIPAEEA